jgi:SM-20-related protein
MDCATTLREQGLWVRDGFLTHEETLALRQDLELHRPKLGRALLGQEKLERPEIRGDSTLWWDPVRLNPPQERLAERLEALRTELNQTLFLGLVDWEGHYALYPPGAGYSRHLDRFRADDRRTVSFVVYLNSEWPEGSGGELEAEPSGGEILRIAPLPGRAVVFLSAEVPHAVLPATRERISFAGWFRRRSAL